MTSEKSAGVVVFCKENKKNNYLLLHYQLGHWDLPKGHIEKEEGMLDTAKREVFEETGIKDLEFIDGFKKTIRYFFWFQGKKIFKTVVFYLAQTKSKRIKLSSEHIGYEWLDYEKALKKLTFKNAKDVLKEAHGRLFRLSLHKNKKDH